MVSLSTAFTAPLGASVSSVSTFRSSALCTLVPRTTSSVRMSASDKNKRAFVPSPSVDEENRRVRKESEYRGPQGFTPYAERVNGRLAQLGFVIGLVTEVVSGKPMGEQILIMFSPLLHAAQELAVLSASASHLLQ